MKYPDHNAPVLAVCLDLIEGGTANRDRLLAVIGEAKPIPPIRSIRGLKNIPPELLRKVVGEKK